MDMELIRFDFISKLADFGVFWPWEPRIYKKKKSDHTRLVCVYANILVNIFKDAGQVLREIWGGARTLIAHDLYTISSIRCPPIVLALSCGSPPLINNALCPLPVPLPLPSTVYIADMIIPHPSMRVTIDRNLSHIVDRLPDRQFLFALYTRPTRHTFSRNLPIKVVL